MPYKIFYNFFQDRHMNKHSDGEPLVDRTQDYILLQGYENATHTVLRFRRKLDTCDKKHDVPITVSKNAIQLLEVEQAINRQLLKEQLHLAYERLKPVNLLKSSLHEVISSPTLTDNILGTVISLASGFLTKKLVVGASGNIIRKVLGSILQFGVTTVVQQHPDAIKSVGRFIYQHIIQKKERNPA